MKNHFVFSYAGNKRDEVEIIYNNLDFDDIITIIEPYCGTGAMSYYISLQQPKKYKYILNDANTLLIELFNIISDKDKLITFEKEINEIAKTLITKNLYIECLKNINVKSYYISQKIYNIKPGLYPLNYKYNYIDILNCPIINFLQTENIRIMNIDAVTLINENINNKNVMILCDPPYISTNNTQYNYDTIAGPINIYEWSHNQFNINRKKMKCHFYIILEENWITKLLYKNLNVEKYDKKYTGVKKKTVIHCIYTNMKIINIL